MTGIFASETLRSHVEAEIDKILISDNHAFAFFRTGFGS